MAGEAPPLSVMNAADYILSMRISQWSTDTSAHVGTIAAVSGWLVQSARSGFRPSWRPRGGTGLKSGHSYSHPFCQNDGSSNAGASITPTVWAPSKSVSVQALLDRQWSSRTRVRTGWREVLGRLTTLAEGRFTALNHRLFTRRLILIGRRSLRRLDERLDASPRLRFARIIFKTELK
jgi:hypothetical protein